MTIGDGALVPAVSALASWTLTFLLHSSLLVAGVWLLCRLRPGWSFRVKNFLWRVALIGAVVSTSVQLLATVALPHFTL